MTRPDEIRREVVPTHEEFRKVGYTGEAANYPLSDAAVWVVLELNGVREQARAGAWKPPVTWRYAPNAAMRDWLEALAKHIAAGGPLYDDHGRVLTASTLPQPEDDDERR